MVLVQRGISTFNRQLCRALARQGHNILCLVPSFTLEEQADAQQSLVRLLAPPRELGDVGLAWPGVLPEQTVPDVVIGHGRHSGPFAYLQRELQRPVATLVHFVHIEPEAIEPYKIRASSLDTSADERGDAELLSSQRADLVFAVGPLLTREHGTRLAAIGAQVHEFLPGLSDTPLTHGAPPAVRCLVVGRLDEPLKAVDLAAQAFGQMNRTTIQPRPVLVVRGAPAADVKRMKDTLLALGRLDAQELRVLPYTHEEARLQGEVLKSSLLLMPSRTEGFGLVGLEAISAGIPTLISAESGLAEVISTYAPKYADCVIRVTGQSSVDVPAWAAAIEYTLFDRAAAFARAAGLREALAPVLDWQKSVQNFVSLARATGQRRAISVSASTSISTALPDNDTQRRLIKAALDQIVRRSLDSELTNVVVARPSLEEAILERVGANSKWISVEGESGTGKTTLLFRVLRHLASRGQAVALLDAAALSLGTSVSEFLPECELRADTIWGRVRELRDRLPPAVPLTLLLDTLDAALISDRRSQVLGLLRDLETVDGIVIVSFCRPLEADAYLPRKRTTVQVLDFSVEEAREAIARYRDVYYAHLSAAARLEAGRVLNTHLQSSSFADLCRRPVMLRMFFEAYSDRPPSEAVDRARLFSDYWRLKVAGVNSHRPSRSSPASRQECCRRVAFEMYRRRSTYLGEGDRDQLLSAQGLTMDSFNDLRSEAVLASEGQSPYAIDRFFHQSFLEYAAARAILELAIDRDREITDLTNDLRDETRTPWFALLEEVAKQAQRYTATIRIHDVVLDGLLSSAAAGAAASAARVWSHTAPGPQARQRQDKVLSHKVARLACLHYMHNAAIDRLRDLLDHVAVPAWNESDHALRLGALDALTRATHLVPDHVKSILGALSVGDAILNDKATPNRGQYVTRLARLYAAFFGVDDVYASESLDRMYRTLLKRGEAVHRANVIEDILEHATLSPEVGILIRRWFETKEPRRELRAVIVREAFAKGAARTDGLSDDVVIESIDQELARPTYKANRLRLWTVCREKLRRGSEGVWEVISALFRTTSSPEFVAEIGDVIMRPLAAEAPSVFALLIDVAMDPDSEASGRRRMSLNALGDAVASFQQARSGLALLPTIERAPDGYAPYVLRFLGRCAHATTVEERSHLLATLPDSLDLTAMVGGFQPIASDFLNTVVLRALRNVSRATEETLAKHLVLVQGALDGPTRASVVRWLLHLLDSPRREIPRIASEAVRQLLDGVEETLWHEAFGRVASRLTSTREDAHGGAHGHTLSDWLQRSEASDRERDIASRAVMTVLASGNVGRETRRGAFAILKELARVEPGRVEGEIDGLLERLHGLLRQSERVTDDLTGIGQVIYFISLANPEGAWRLLRRVVELSENANLGRGGWDKVCAVSSGTVRSGLEHDSVRADIVAKLSSLPDLFQAMVVRCARDRNDPETFKQLSKLSLSQAAVGERELWAHERSRAIGETA